MLLVISSTLALCHLNMKPKNMYREHGLHSGLAFTVPLITHLSAHAKSINDGRCKTINWYDIFSPFAEGNVYSMAIHIVIEH